MPVIETWPEYVRRVTRGHSQAQIAAKTGVAESNISRWMRGTHGQPKPENVLALAKAFDQPPIEALIAAGYVSREDVNAERTPLSAYTMAELIDELRRRTVD